MDAPPPLSKSEQALAQIKADEANEASNRLAALFGHPSSSPSRDGGASGAKSPLKSPEIGIRNAIGIGAGGIGGGGGVRAGLKWTDEVESKLQQLAEGGDETGRAVILHIEPKTETLRVQESIQVSPADLAGKMPTKEPAFTFYAWPVDKEAAAATTAAKASKSAQPSRSNSLQVPGAADKDANADPADVPLPVSPAVETPPAVDASKDSDTAPEPEVEEPTAAKPRPTIVMIYSCPSASPVRYRMIYSSSVRSTIYEASQRIGFPIDKKVSHNGLA